MNTNPNAKRILCFGDSNTWGYVSGSDHNRLPIDKRWSGVLQKHLGENFEVIEEGLNSRAINNEDPRPGKDGRNATQYILPCLDTHDLLDFIIVMLGTNELKYGYKMTPEAITESMASFIKLIQNRKSQFRKVIPEIILITTPLINENTAYCMKDNKYLGATEKSKKLTELFIGLANKLKIKFVDSSKTVEPGIDGVHITEKSHSRLGRTIYKLIS